MDKIRQIFVPISKLQLDRFINDVSYEMDGNEEVLSQSDFNVLWKSDILIEYYKKTEIFIDDFETTIINNQLDVSSLQDVIKKNSSTNKKMIAIKDRILILVELSLERNSGIIFFL